MRPDHQLLPQSGAGLRSPHQPGLFSAEPQRLDSYPALFQECQGKRIEYRCPDASCNPYLAFPAMLLAGLDGIKNKIDPGNPIDKDIYELEPEEKAKIKSTPGSLGEVLDALKKDHDYLLQGDVFTEDLIETWINYKKKNEMDAIALRPHPYEFHLYYDI